MPKGVYPRKKRAKKPDEPAKQRRKPAAAVPVAKLVKGSRHPRRLNGLNVQSAGPNHCLVNVPAATVRKWAYAFREAHKLFG